MKVPADPVSGEGTLPSLEKATFPLCPHVAVGDIYLCLLLFL